MEVTGTGYESQSIRKMEAMLVLLEAIGVKLLNCSGLEIENCNMEVSQITECKFGANCYRTEKSCPFHHVKSENEGKSIDGDGNSDERSKQKCWFQQACPLVANVLQVVKMREVEKLIEPDGVL